MRAPMRPFSRRHGDAERDSEYVIPDSRAPELSWKVEDFGYSRVLLEDFGHPRAILEDFGALSSPPGGFRAVLSRFGGFRALPDSKCLLGE